MITIEKLKEYGADVDAGISRCGKNEALYLRLVKMCVEELSSNDLKEALEKKDLGRAFDVAHKLKGGVSNLALDPVFKPICELTELLRHKTPGDYDELYNKIESETKKLIALEN